MYTFSVFMQAGQVRWDVINISKLKKDQMNAPDKEGFVLLHYAVLDQRVDIIRKLLHSKCGEFGIIIVICLEII